MSQPSDTLHGNVRRTVGKRVLAPWRLTSATHVITASENFAYYTNRLRALLLIEGRLLSGNNRCCCLYCPC